MPRQYRLSRGRKAFNGFLKWLNGLGLQTGSTFLLTTTGHKSGQQRTTPVTLVIENGRRWVVSPYGQVAWVRNVRANGRALLRSGRKTESVQLREISPTEAAPILKRYLASNGITAPFFDATKDDALDRFVAEASLHPVFMVQPI